MKQVRFCFEVQGMATDENGNPAPAGMQISLGDVPDEKYDAVMESAKGVKVTDLLRYFGFESIASEHPESDFKLIDPEKYDREYGDETAQAGEGSTTP